MLQRVEEVGVCLFEVRETSARAGHLMLRSFRRFKLAALRGTQLCKLGTQRRAIDARGLEALLRLCEILESGFVLVLCSLAGRLECRDAGDEVVVLLG